MPSLIDTATRRLGPDVIDRMGREIGADGVTTERATAVALPLMVGALARNARRPPAARALNEALREHHDGSLLDELPTAIVDRAVQDDGEDILGHMFGRREPAVRNGVSRASGLGSAQVARLLSMVAPVVMAALARMRRSDDLSADDLAARLDLERRAMVRRDEAVEDLLAKVLDGDGDGSFLEEIGGRLLEDFLLVR